MQIPVDYYESKDVAKSYERILFLPRVLQSQELNGLQAIFESYISKILKTLFQDGQIISGTVFYDGKTLTTKNLVLIMDGLPRAVEDVSLPIPDNIKTIKGKITKKIITPEDDTDILDPVDGENYKEHGALRLKTTAELIASPEKSSKDDVTIWRIENKKLLKSHNNLENLQLSTFDRVIDLTNETLALEGLAPGTRVFIKGGDYKINAPVKITGERVQIEFSPLVFLYAEDNPPFNNIFEIEGSVKIIGCRLGLKGKKKEMYLAHVPKGSRLFMHDYTHFGLEPGMTGDGIFQQNVVWGETHD